MPAFDVGKPEGLCVLKDGRIAVTDTHYHRVVFFDREGRVVGMHGEYGREPGQFVYPVAITQDDDENYYICEYGDNDRVQKFSVDGTFLLEFGSFGTQPGQFQRPSGIIWDEHRIFVADAINNRIQVFSDTGDYESILEHEGALPRLHYPYDMIQGDDDLLYVVEYGAGRVTCLKKTGEVLGRWGQIGSDKGQLTTPWGLAMGGDGQLVVADTGNRRLVEIRR
jgi:DNA-binding beta-propeller fold protein YncE